MTTAVHSPNGDSNNAAALGGLVVEDIYVAIGGPLLVAVVAYALNSWRERAFEKRKASFHAKREAFTRMNDALSRVGANLAYLKEYTAQDWANEAPQQLAQSVIRML